MEARREGEAEVVDLLVAAVDLRGEQVTVRQPAQGFDAGFAIGRVVDGGCGAVGRHQVQIATDDAMIAHQAADHRDL